MVILPILFRLKYVGSATYQCEIKANVFFIHLIEDEILIDYHMHDYVV